jgi:hypothetical protein
MGLLEMRATPSGSCNNHNMQYHFVSKNGATSPIQHKFVVWYT